ncbi:hypothetical protein GQ44DRAFT_135868 [Phaeosphaeriaceae sp. PMI808]|nr:hypothetical protein GQ44DRAFT_135868 [Phaeosphaeriaceae sp. PMI808]
MPRSTLVSFPRVSCIVNIFAINFFPAKFAGAPLYCFWWFSTPILLGVAPHCSSLFTSCRGDRKFDMNNIWHVQGTHPHTISCQLAKVNPFYQCRHQTSAEFQMSLSVLLTVRLRKPTCRLTALRPRKQVGRQNIILAIPAQSPTCASSAKETRLADYDSAKIALVAAEVVCGILNSELES